MGGQERTPGHTHTGTVAYCHPYTKASLCSSEAVRPGQALLAPAGEAEVYDLRVEHHSHYITSGGIISQNCGFDELCQFPEHQAKFLHSRLRSSDGIPLQYKGTGNPRGIGMLWVKAHYVDPATPETLHWYRFKAPDGRTFKSSVLFIPGRLEDNPSLGDDYELSLASIGNPKLYQALRLGDWNALIGDAFPDWDPDLHIISWADFASLHGLILQVRSDGSEFVEIPKTWPIFMSYDWGTARPFSVGWWTADTYGRLFRIYEWYGSARMADGKTVPNQGLHMSTRDQARGILQREDEWGIAGRVSMRLADPSVRNSHARKEDIPGPSVQEIMAEERVYLTLANNDRIQGKTQIHERLRISEFVDPNGAIEETPGMMVLSHCKDWLRTVPTAPVSPVNPEDVDKTAELHCLAGDTWVEAEHGPVLIQDLVGTSGRLWSFDGERPVLKPFHGVRRTREAVPTFEVKLADGRSFTGTGNHDVLLDTGDWVRIENLQPGDQIVDLFGMMKPDTDKRIHHARHDHQRAGAGVQRGEVLPGGQVLLQAAGGPPTPHRVGVSSRPNPALDARASQGPRPGEQPNRELGAAAQGGAPQAPRQHAGEQGRKAGAYAEHDGAQGSGVACLGRGQVLAQSASQADVVESAASRGDVRLVWQGLPHAAPHAGEVLRTQLQDGGPAAASGHAAREGARHADVSGLRLFVSMLEGGREVLPGPLLQAGRERFSEAETSGTATVVAVTPSRVQDVYNLEVADTHCFAVNGGFIVHNCYDETRYMLMGRPWKARYVAEERGWSRMPSKRRSAGEVA